MEVFFANLFSSFLDEYNVKKKQYMIALTFVVVGLLIGIILIFAYDDLELMLEISNKNYMSFMHGTADLSSIFLENFRWIIIADIIVILFSLSGITYALGLSYIAYQSALVSITIGAMISTFGFTGILNCLFLILPFNILNVIMLTILIVSLHNFFVDNKKSGVSYFSCKRDKFAYIRICMIVLIQILLCLIMSYFVPYLLKSLVIVNF